MDFGLAKALDRGVQVQADLSVSPTITSPEMTIGGVILGTAAYMSPEQARGKPVDNRSDIWGFGCVLYEMLARKSAFSGETVTDLLAAVVMNEPEWQALPDDMPPMIRSLLRRCLKKDPGSRLRDIIDARIEIEEAIAEPTSPTRASASPSRSPIVGLIPWAIAALFAVALLVTLITRGTAPSPSAPVTRLELNMPPGVEAGMTNSPNLAISPDGTRVAFAGALGGMRRLYVRRFDEFQAVALKGTETVNVAHFSPDGTALAFITTDRTLRKVSLADGLVTTLASDVDYTGGGLAWSADGRITFGRSGTLWQVPATGGVGRQLTTLDSKQNEGVHAWPAALPNDKAILFTSVTGGERIAMHIESLSLATGERRRVTDAGSSPMYAPSGHLLFFRDGSCSLRHSI